MTAVTGDLDPTELLVAIGMAVVGFGSIRPCVHAYVAWFNRHLMPPIASGGRAPRGGRASLPAGLSPEPAGSELAAHPQIPCGRRAVEMHTPDGVSTAPGEQR